MQSIVSYPDRGPFGDNKWRGNTSGWIIVDLLQFASNLLKKPMSEILLGEHFMGGGSGRDAATHCGAQYVGLDLHLGNDICSQSMLSQLPRPCDVSFGHPPYSALLAYSGSQWGESVHEADLSKKGMPLEEFHAKMQVALLNMREATAPGGIYSILTGDIRIGGQFTSLQSELIARSPKDELISVVIKQQHNCLSDATRYSGASFIPIRHEYLCVFRRNKRSMYQVCYQIAQNIKSALDSTWRSLIRLVMMELGEAKLDSIYKEVERVAGAKCASNASWKAKVRQTLQYHHTNVARGVWAI